MLKRVKKKGYWNFSPRPEWRRLLVMLQLEQNSVLWPHSSFPLWIFLSIWFFLFLFFFLLGLMFSWETDVRNTQTPRLFLCILSQQSFSRKTGLDSVSSCGARAQSISKRHTITDFKKTTRPGTKRLCPKQKKTKFSLIELMNIPVQSSQLRSFA